MEDEYPGTEEELTEMRRIEKAIAENRKMKLPAGKKLSRRQKIFNRWLRIRRRLLKTTAGRDRCIGPEYCACGEKKLLSEKRCIACADAICVISHRVAYQSQNSGRDKSPGRAWESIPRPIKMLTPGIYDTDFDSSFDDIIRAYEEYR